SLREAGHCYAAAGSSQGEQLMRPRSILHSLVVCAIIPATSVLSQTPVAASAAPKVDSETISGLGARNIGSAAMSGRVSALTAVHEGDRLTVYIGAASGGVWKSANGGTTYKPVFDKETSQSI